MIFIIRNPRHNPLKSISTRRIAVIEHPDINKEHIDRALTDKNFYVRKSAIQHPNATKDHIDVALTDRDETVRKVAIQHSNATKEHINKALNDKDELVRTAAETALKENKK